MSAAFILFLGLVGIFIFSIVSFVRKNQQLRQAQIAREQAFLAAMTRDTKGQSKS